jgi:hypothetical protein
VRGEYSPRTINGFAAPCDQTVGKCEVIGIFSVRVLRVPREGKNIRQLNAMRPRVAHDAARRIGMASSDIGSGRKMVKGNKGSASIIA